MPAISPDIIGQIGVFFKNILIHNSLAVVFATGAVIWFLLALYRPTRTKLITLIGFLILLFAFEYNKHIATPLLLQTQQTLQTQIAHARFDWLVRVILTKIGPVVLYGIGALCIIGGMLIGGWSAKKNNV